MHKISEAKVSVAKKPSLSVDEAVRCICTYFNEAIKDGPGRYLFWCHCYVILSDNRERSEPQNETQRYTFGK